MVAERTGEVVAYVTLRCMEQYGLRGGMIVDLVAAPGREKVLFSLLGHAERLLREQQMDVMACLVNGDDRYMRLLRKQGFLPPPGKIGFKEWYFGYRINRPTVSEEVCADRSSWFLTFEMLMSSRSGASTCLPAGGSGWSGEAMGNRPVDPRLGWRTRRAIWMVACGQSVHITVGLGRDDRQA